MTNMNKKNERYRYPMFTCRVSEEVMAQLKAAKLLSDKSWNGFFKEILNKYKNELEQHKT